jgi:hypothetical protein
MEINLDCVYRTVQPLIDLDKMNYLARDFNGTFLFWKTHLIS